MVRRSFFADRSHEQDIREEDVIIKDPFFVQEAYTFIYDGLGRPVPLNDEMGKLCHAFEKMKFRDHKQK